MARFLTNVIKGALMVSGLICMAPLFSEHTATADPWTAPAMGDYAKTPPFISYTVKPNIMIILDNSGSMNDQAYADNYNGEPYNDVADTIYEVGDDSLGLATDDMEENLSGVLRDGVAGANDLDLGTDYVGIRFQNVPIAQGAEIEGAYIQFTAIGTTPAPSDLVIQAELSDDANPMNVSNNYDISGRSYTTASTSWSPPVWTDGQTYNTPDISEVVQEIVDQATWADGNSMLFMISGTAFPGSATGHRQAYSREAGQNVGPILRILVKDQEAARYYGYYNPDYFYQFSSNVFYPIYKKVNYDFTANAWNVETLGGGSATIDDSDIAPAIAANGLWDGNWLNWTSMRRVDVLRKVLMGGLATSRTGGGNSHLIGETPAPGGWWYDKWFNTSGDGPAVSPYNGNYMYRGRDGYIYVYNSSWSYQTRYAIEVEKDFSTDPEDFYEGNLAGILQRIGDRARWGNMWFNDGDTNSGGTIQNTIADANITNMITNLQNTGCTTWTPLAETFYVAMSNFMQTDVASGLGYPNGAEMNSNRGQDPYWDQGRQEYVPCAKSFVLLLTDGASTMDAKIPSAYIDYDNDGNDSVSCSDCSTDYLDDLALYARTQDLRPGVYTGDHRTPLDGDQNIILYTVFAFDNDPVARALLKDAARNGGFEDLNGDGIPNGDYTDPPADRLEWDQNGDGDPDTYYEASDGYVLSEKLLQAINDILARASSGTAASVISNSRTGEGAVTQSIFFPAITEGGNTVEWVGQVQSLMVDAYGNLREDTNGNDRLDHSDDLFIVFTDEDDPVKKYRDLNGNGQFDDSERAVAPVAEGKIRDIAFLWNSSEWLNEITDANINQQRNYASVGLGRYIFTFVDRDGDMVADLGEQVDFVATSDPTWTQVNDENSFYAYIHPYTPFTPPISTGHADFQSVVTRQVRRTVNFIRGQDQNLEYVGSTLLSPFRARQIDYDNDGQVETWRLGDIIYSTPSLAGTPAEDYDLIWRDRTYVDFFLQYKMRRNMVYVGANDGMIHAFNAGFYDKDIDGYGFFRQPMDDNGDPDTTYTAYELGAEMWAYVPRNLLSHLHWLTDMQYQHVYYNDLKPRIFDAKIFPDDATHPSGWGTLLVAGMRFGGGRISADIDKTDGAYNPNVDKSMSSAYAIFDITDPEQPPVLLAEINFPRLGFTTCVPGVIPMRDIDTSQSGLQMGNDNQWILLFGSGPIEADGAFYEALIDGTSNQQAVLYAIDLEQLVTGNSVVTLSGGGTKTYPSSGAPYYWTEFSETESMVARPVAVDFDLDFNTDVVYFGTTYGSHTGGWHGLLRRVVPDINQTAAAWETNSILIDLTDVIANNQGQPITAPANVGMDDLGNRWVFFGTGRYYGALDAENTNQQAYYGIKEPYTTGSGGEKEFSYTASVNYGDLMDVSNIEVYQQGQTLAGYSGDFVGLQNDIENNYDGWRMDFTFEPEQERNLGQAVLSGEVLTFTTYLPSPDVCSIGGESVAYGLYYRTGTAYLESIFGTDPSDVDGSGNERVLKRLELGNGLSISPNIHIGRNDGSEVYIQTSTGAIKSMREMNPGEIKSRKLSWQPDTACP